VTWVLAAVDWRIIRDRIIHPDSTFAWALWKTVYIAVVSQFLGVLFGLVAALMRMSRLRVVRMLSGAYVLVFRGTPVIVQIFFVYFGANLLFGFDLFPRNAGIGPFTVSGAILAGITALSLNEGAYMREIIRAGIDSIDRGQMEAAKSLGMTYGLSMRRIVLPQAARVIVPPLGNEFNNMLKTTSLLAFIGVYELFLDADVHYSSTFKPVEYFTAVAFWYLVLTTIWTFIQSAIERKLAVGERDEVPSFRDRLAGVWTAAPVRGRGGSH
jgi:polar amino acid transport system permease protein